MAWINEWILQRGCVTGPSCLLVLFIAFWNLSQDESSHIRFSSCQKPLNTLLPTPTNVQTPSPSNNLIFQLCFQPKHQWKLLDLYSFLLTILTSPFHPYFMLRHFLIPFSHRKPYPTLPDQTVSLLKAQFQSHLLLEIGHRNHVLFWLSLALLTPLIWSLFLHSNKRHLSWIWIQGS